MRILRPEETSQTPNPEPVSAAQDNERVEALEKITASILKKLNALDERMALLEKAPEPSRTSPVPSPLAVDPEAVKKGLMTKMWTYLNDKAA